MRSCLILHLCLLGVFLNYWFSLITGNYSVILFIFSFFFIQSWRLFISMNLSFLLGFLFCWHINYASTVVSYCLYFCDVDYNFSHFIYLYSLFLDESGQSLSILSFQRASFWLHYVLCFLFVYTSFISIVIFTICFLLLTFWYLYL